MSTPKIFTSISNVAGKAWFATKQRSPEICLITGLLGFGATIVLACKATKKIDTIKEAKEREEQDIENLAKTSVDPETYKRQEKAKLYIRTTGKYIMLYGPAIATGGLSVLSILVSHHILKERNLFLGAAYSALDKGFRTYRERVAERFGDEVEKEIRYGLAPEMPADDSAENQNEQTGVAVDKPSGNDISPYARFFDESSTAYEKDAEANLIFLKQMQEKFNVVLKAKGHVYLNEVYEALGIPPSNAGHHVGWIYDEKHPHGDNFIDFGIYNANRERARAFVNGLERAIILDFNVDGVIDGDPRTYYYEI